MILIDGDVAINKLKEYFLTLNEINDKKTVLECMQIIISLFPNTCASCKYSYWGWGEGYCEKVDKDMQGDDGYTMWESKR